MNKGYFLVIQLYNLGKIKKNKTKGKEKENDENE